jgi:hypothetical protein
MSVCACVYVHVHIHICVSIYTPTLTSFDHNPTLLQSYHNLTHYIKRNNTQHPTGLVGKKGYSTNLPIRLTQEYDIGWASANRLAKAYGGRARDVLDISRDELGKGYGWSREGELAVSLTLALSPGATLAQIFALTLIITLTLTLTLSFLLLL